jgi:DNA repair ATPase RecN
MIDIFRNEHVSNFFSFPEREVKKATRDLNQLLNNIESPMTRLETVHKKYTELLADMKKLDRDHSKSKKRADQLQKDQDKGKSELNKTLTMKDKLEKLCRELTKENKKVKVGTAVHFFIHITLTILGVMCRTTTKSLKRMREELAWSSMNG